MGNVSSRLFGKPSLGQVTLQEIDTLLETSSSGGEAETESLEATYLGANQSGQAAPVPFNRGQHLEKDILKPCASFASRGPGRGGILVLGYKLGRSGEHRHIGVEGLTQQQLENFLRSNFRIYPRGAFPPAIETATLIHSGKTILLAEVEAASPVLCGSLRSGEYYFRQGSSSRRLSPDEVLGLAESLGSEILVPDLRYSLVDNGQSFDIDLFIENRGNRPAPTFQVILEIGWHDNVRPTEPTTWYALPSDREGLQFFQTSEGQSLRVETMKRAFYWEKPLYPGILLKAGDLCWPHSVVVGLRFISVSLYSQRGSGIYHYQVVRHAYGEGPIPRVDFTPLPSTKVWAAYE